MNFHRSQPEASGQQQCAAPLTCDSFGYANSRAKVIHKVATKGCPKPVKANKIGWSANCSTCLWPLPCCYSCRAPSKCPADLPDLSRATLNAANVNEFVQDSNLRVFDPLHLGFAPATHRTPASSFDYESSDSMHLPNTCEEPQCKRRDTIKVTSAQHLTDGHGRATALQRPRSDCSPDIPVPRSCQRTAFTNWKLFKAVVNSCYLCGNFAAPRKISPPLQISNRISIDCSNQDEDRKIQYSQISAPTPVPSICKTQHAKYSFPFSCCNAGKFLHCNYYSRRPMNQKYEHPDKASFILGVSPFQDRGRDDCLRCRALLLLVDYLLDEKQEHYTHVFNDYIKQTEPNSMTPCPESAQTTPTARSLCGEYEIRNMNDVKNASPHNETHNAASESMHQLDSSPMHQLDSSPMHGSNQAMEPFSTSDTACGNPWEACTGMDKPAAGRGTNGLATNSMAATISCSNKNSHGVFTHELENESQTTSSRILPPLLCKNANYHPCRLAGRTQPSSLTDKSEPIKPLERKSNIAASSLQPYLSAHSHHVAPLETRERRNTHSNCNDGVPNIETPNLFFADYNGGASNQDLDFPVKNEANDATSRCTHHQLQSALNMGHESIIHNRFTDYSDYSDPIHVFSEESLD